jgi:c-di-GMP-binding flagellar brake protein YcgR
MRTENRSNRRFAYHVEVKLTRGEASLEARTHNLSLGGAMIELAAAERFKVGERLRVAIPVPELDAPLEADAEVRWVSALDERVGGVQFVTGLRAKHIWALNRLFDELKKQGV